MLCVLTQRVHIFFAVHRSMWLSFHIFLMDYESSFVVLFSHWTAKDGFLSVEVRCQHLAKAHIP